MWKDGKVQLAHRVVWEESNGPIPEGMVIMHTCDVRSCVELGHLVMGTQAENLADMWDKGRDNHIPLFGCGHSLNKENVYERPSTGGKECRVCRASRRKEYKQRRIKV